MAFTEVEEEEVAVQSLPQLASHKCAHGLPAAAGSDGVPMQLQRWSLALISTSSAFATPCCTCTPTTDSQ